MPLQQSRNSRRRAAATLVAVLAGASLTLSTPTAAQASSPCTSLTFYRVGGYPGGADMHVPTVGWQTGNKHCYLTYGHSGSAVLVLQEALNNCYSRSLSLDGNYGTKTREAVRYAQHRINEDIVYADIAEDGEYGPQTRAYMGFAIFGVDGGPVIPNVCYYPG